MSRNLTLLAGAALFALAGYAVGQQLAPTSFSGNESWVVAVQGPGGTSEFVTTGIMQNSQGIVTQTLAAPFTMSSNQADLCITAQPASGANITLPASPFNGQIFEVINCTASAFATNVFSIVPNTGQTLLGGNIALTTLAAGASRELRYVLSTNTWYPLR